MGVDLDLTAADDSPPAPTGELPARGVFTARVEGIRFTAPIQGRDRGVYVVCSVVLADLAGDATTTTSASASTHTITGDDHDEIIKKGGIYRFHGQFRNTPRYGRQFQFTSVIRHVPHDRAGVIRYLVETCSGVGRGRAERLWDAFGQDAMRILREDPTRLAEAGLLPFTVAALASHMLAALAHHEATRIDLWTILDGRGFPRVLIQACIDKWGVRAPAVIRRDPFRLMTARLPGCGFIRCDKLWLDLGKPAAAMKRQVLAAIHAIQEDRAGHTWFDAEGIREGIRQRVSDAGGGERGVRADRALAIAVRAGYLRVRKDANGFEWVALDRHAGQEEVVAKAVARLLARGCGSRAKAEARRALAREQMRRLEETL